MTSNLYLAIQVQEFLDSGTTLRAAYEDTPQSRAIAIFGLIYGVGPSKAHELYEKGARS